MTNTQRRAGASAVDASISDCSKKKPSPVNGTFILVFTSLPACKTSLLCADGSLCDSFWEADARTCARDWLVSVDRIPFWTKPPTRWVFCSSSCTGTMWAKYAVWFSESWKMSLLITWKQSEIFVKFWKILVCFSFRWLHQSSGKEGCPHSWWLMAILQITDARRHS